MKSIKVIPSRDRIVAVSVISSVILFTLTFSSVFFTNQTWIDEKAFQIISPYISEERTSLMKFISSLGRHSFLIPANLVLIILFAVLHKKWMAIRVTFVALTSLGLMSLLKNLLQRQRPPEPLVAGITNFSFPSGHAFMGITFYGLLIWMIAVHVKNKWQKGLAITLLSLLIIVIGLSRVYLRVHYTTDVLAGFSIGFVWLIACLNMVEKAESGFVNKS
ncbi:MAG: phosphatase PAP2 family protein [Chitinophagaceae bacterium]|nr:phosphatase PAP2 family protein [Chitinophagaceae bacterium]MBP6215678.1 phosphatase PAP2 family protein [Chitinophagaceae bacterium]